MVIANIILNLGLIPSWGIQGAAFATFLSYLLCYCIRMIDARYYVPFRFSLLRTVLNTSILLLMCIPIIFGFKSWIFWEILLTAAITFLNFDPLLITVKKLLKREL